MTTNSEKTYEIVSLGVNCLPRTVLTRHGIKPSKAQGELSCPFDLVRHTLDRVIHYIETDFDDYLDDIYFQIKKRNLLDFRKKGLWKKTDGTTFFHDKDCKYNDFEKITTRISNRIENFRKILSSELPILFVLNIQEYPEEIERLYNILKSKCGEKKFKLAIFDIGKIVKYEIKNNDIHILQLPLPIPEYHNGYIGWNSKQWKDSELAKYVEILMCEFIQNILETEF